MENKYYYLEEAVVTASTSVKVENIGEFEKLVNSFQPVFFIKNYLDAINDSYYKQKNKDSACSLGFIHQNVYYCYVKYKIAKEDVYPTYEQLLDGLKRGLDRYSLYKMGYLNFTEYSYVADTFPYTKIGYWLRNNLGDVLKNKLEESNKKKGSLYVQEAWREYYLDSLEKGFPTYAESVESVKGRLLLEAKQLVKDVNQWKYEYEMLEYSTLLEKHNLELERCENEFKAEYDLAKKEYALKWENYLRECGEKKLEPFDEKAKEQKNKRSYFYEKMYNMKNIPSKPIIPTDDSQEEQIFGYEEEEEYTYTLEKAAPTTPCPCQPRLNSEEETTWGIYTDIILMELESLEHFVRNMKEKIASIEEKVGAKKEGFDTVLAYQNFKKSNFSKGADYRDAAQKGFENHDDYSEAKRLQIDTFSEYQEFKKCDFESIAEYRIASAKGFLLKNDYQKAVEVGAEDKKELDKFLSLEKMILNGEANYNQELLLQILEKSEIGDQETMPNLFAEFKKLREAKIKENDVLGLLDKYLVQELQNNLDSFIDFIEKNDRISTMGIVNRKIGFFERRDMPSKSVIVDTSNVAWGNQDKNKGGKPLAKNIELIKKELEKNGFLKILFLADANLKLQIDDSTVFERIDIQCVPARNRADDFIIKKAKDSRCFIVSNDTFKQAKEQDSWVAQNIDDWRISFLIEGGVITLNNKKLGAL